VRSKVAGSSSVTCECGLDDTAQSKNSTDKLTSLLGSGSAINVAVMTQFVAGDIGGTVVSGNAFSSDIAAKSRIIFVSFGLLWGFGFLSMAVHFFAIDLTFLLRKKDAVDPLGKSMGKVEPAPDGTVGAALQRASETKQRAYAAMKKYVISVLPSVYHPVPWLRRLKEQITDCP